jgi:hypothetical protein
MSVKEIDTLLKSLPLNDKIGALIVNLCEHDKDAIAAIQKLIVTAGIIGQNLRHEVDRRSCANSFRETATEIERHKPLGVRE